MKKIKIFCLNNVPGGPSDYDLRDIPDRTQGLPQQTGGLAINRGKHGNIEHCLLTTTLQAATEGPLPAHNHIAVGQGGTRASSWRRFIFHRHESCLRSRHEKIRACLLCKWSTISTSLLVWSTFSETGYQSGKDATVLLYVTIWTGPC
jgi:hypothetical protein